MISMKIYKHKICVIFICCFLGSFIFAENVIVDISSQGIAISPYIRGQSTRSIPLDSLNAQGGIVDKTLDVVNNSMLRGVGGGLIDDTYDWRDPQGKNKGWDGIKTWPAIQYLRWARDHNAQPLVTANTRGVGTFWGGHTTFVYYDKDLSMLQQLAADYVRYTNFILPTYRMGDTLPAGRDKDIVDYIRWSHELGSWNPLLEQNEGLTPKVTYWEIGNEPEVTVSSLDAYILTAAQYRDRYKAISQAMLAEDPSIKVGPCFNGAYQSYLQVLAADSEARIDFVSYHPYGNMYGSGAYGNITALEGALKNVKGIQLYHANIVRQILIGTGRNPNIPLIASEWNPGDPWINETMESRTMAHTLACAETLFAYAETQLFGATYWLWGDDRRSSEMSMHIMFELMQEHLGNNLKYSYTDNQTFRLYVTKDSQTDKTALWGLNFSDTVDKSITLSLNNLGFNPWRITLYKIAASNGGDLSLMTESGTTTLVLEQQDLTGADIANMNLTFDDATLTVVVLEKNPKNCDAVWDAQLGMQTDFNKDCYINLADFAVFIQDWLSCNKPADSGCTQIW